MNVESCASSSGLWGFATCCMGSPRLVSVRRDREWSITPSRKLRETANVVPRSAMRSWLPLVLVLGCRARPDVGEARAVAVDPPARSGAMAPSLQADDDGVLASWAERAGERGHRVVRTDRDHGERGDRGELGARASDRARSGWRAGRVLARAAGRRQGSVRRDRRAFARWRLVAAARRAAR